MKISFRVVAAVGAFVAIAVCVGYFGRRSDGGAQPAGSAPLVAAAPTSAPPPAVAAVVEQESSVALDARGAVAAAAELPPAAALAPFRYAERWDGPLAPALAAFRAWTQRYLAAGSAAERSALEAEGIALAQARRPVLRTIIARDPEAALAMTVPAAIRAGLPAAVTAELEQRFSVRGDFTVLVFDYDAAELARRRARGLPSEPFAYTVAWDGNEYPAFVYGRRSGMVTKHGLPLHGILLDGAVALHDRALRVLEPGETIPVEIGQPPVALELAGRVLGADAVAAVLRDEARLQAAERGIGPTLREVPSEAGPMSPDSIGNTSTTSGGDAAAPATAWTVGTKNVLVIRVDFSDLEGEPRRGSTVYSADYVKNLTDTQVAPFYAQSSYGQTSLVTTVSSKVYRMPQTAAAYATGELNTQLHTDARNAAAVDFTLNNFDRILVLFSSLGGLSGSKITYGGLANVGGKNSWINGSYDFRIVAHELGHTYGLRHANLWLVTDGNPVSAAGTNNEYGDIYDTMGANFANDRRTDFNPWFKNLLGWATDAQVNTVSTNGTFRINRVDNSTGTGTLGLKIVRDGTRNVWVGTRRSFTTNTSMQEGAYVIWGYNTNTGSHLLDLNTPGSSVNDAALAPNATLLDIAGNLSLRHAGNGGTSPNEYLDVQVTLGLNGLPTFSAHPQSQGYNVGDNITLSATVTGTAPLAYQWLRNGSAISGATNLSFAITNAPAGAAGSYALRVSNSVGTVTSNPAVLAVNGPPVVLVPPANTATAAGRLVSLTVAAEGAPTPTYQWRKGGTILTGQTNSTLSFTSVQATDAGSYDVELRNSLGTVVAGPVTLTVNAAGTPPANDAFAAAWELSGGSGVAVGSNSGATGETGEPTHVSTGGTASSVWFRFVADVTGTAQVDTIGSNQDTVIAVYTGSSVSALTKVGEDDGSGGLNTSLLRFAVTAGGTYYIAVGTYSGSGGDYKLNYAAYQAPTIVTPPVAQVGTLGGNTSFSVTAQGTAPRYQWFRNGQPLEGATRSTLAVGPIALSDAGSYTVLVSNPSGSVFSAAATLSGANPAPTITTQPVAVTAVAGQPATLSVVATGDAPLAYQWSRGGRPIEGATTANLLLPAPTRADADYYEVRVLSGLTSTVSQRVRLAVAPSAYPTLVAPDPDWELRPEASGGLGYTAVPLADGRAYIGGQFVSLGGVRRAGIARLTSQGTLDTTFLPPELDNTVRAIAVQADGKVVIAGDFVRVNGFLRNRIARLNTDGSVDAGFDTGSGANAPVYALAITTDGKVVVGGTFQGFAGTNRNYLARLNADGSVDTTFQNRGMTNWVRAVALQADGKLIAGGDFSAGFVAADGTTTTRARLVRVNPDGTLDNDFNPAANNTVTCLAVQSDGKIVVGGFFTTLAGTTVNRLGRLEASGALDTAFTAAGGTGIAVTAPNTPSISCLALQGTGEILVGGTFTSFNGSSVSNFVRLTASGARDTTYQARGFNGSVQGVVGLPSGQAMAVGGFSTYLNLSNVSTSRQRFARMNTDGTIDTGVNFTVGTVGSISSINVLPDGKVIISGFFTTLRGATVPTGLARVNPDGTVDTAFNSGGSGSSSNIYSVLPLADGRMIITGSFSTYNGSPARGIARIKADGTLDSTFAVGNGFGGTGSGYALAALPDGRIFVAGAFTSVDSRPRGRVAVLLPDGSVDPSFAPSSGAGSTVYAAAVQADGKIVIGGSFSSYNGSTAPSVARILANGALDTSFNPGTGPNNAVYALAVQPDGMVLAGGVFSLFADISRGGVARLRSDGGLDTTFVPPSISTTNALHLQEDGRVLVRGTFSTAGGEGSAYLARLTATGARDTTFLAGGFTPSSSTGATFASRMVMGDSGQIFMQSSGSAGMSATEATTLPVITVPPATVAVGVGATATFSVTASSSLPFTYQWLRNGSPLTGETRSTLTIVNAQAANEGNYSVRLTSELGSVTSGSAALLVGAAPGFAGASTLGQLVGGVYDGAFTVEGATAKTMLVRALGPALTVAEALADPRVEIVAAATGTVVASNDDWQSAANASQAQQIANQLGLTALTAGSKDAAILVPLNPGTYRVRIGGPSGATGRAVLEVYEADTVPRLVYAATNLYLNAATGTVNFVTSLPPAGRSYLVRALGPSLGSVSALADPRLLVRSGATPLAQNDDWGGTAELVAAATTAGVLPLAPDSKDAAAIVVPPTASPLAVDVSGPAGASGFVWIEVCEVDAARAATAAPAILVGPERRTVAPGDSVSFGVVAVGKPGPTVQWRKGGLPLAGATGGVFRIGAVTTADAGLYDAAVGNGTQSVTSASALLEVVTATQAPASGGYTAGAPLAIANQFGTTATGRSLSWDVVLPTGWSLVSDNSTATAKPAAGATGTLRWSWNTVPDAGVAFTYTLQVPATETALQIRPLNVVLTLGGNGPTTLFSPRPGPLRILPANLPHSADANGDFRVSLLELTRVIELFNTRNNSVRSGAYRVDAAGEDGFAPETARTAGVTAVLARYHAADSNRDGSIGLFELTRMIQLYNVRNGSVRTGIYRVQSGSEDGYAPGS